MAKSAEINIFKSVLNFRDIGGIPTIDGGTIKKGIIYRSANPDSITKKEAKIFQKLGIKTIVDLRSPHEIKKKRRKIDDIEIISQPLDFELKTREKLKPYLRKKNSEEIISEISNELYLEIADASLPVVKKVLELLLPPGKDPVLIHCQAGKDRTGVVSALIQILLGAERQRIIDEYMKSNDALLPFFKRMLLIRKIISFGFFPSGTILYAITVRKWNIESVIERVESKYGGMESYLLSAGMDIEQIECIRGMLIEK